MKLENNKNCQKLQPRKRPKQFEQRASSAQCPQRAEETEQQASQQHQVQHSFLLKDQSDSLIHKNL